MHVGTIFITGLAILVAALVMNYVAIKLGLATWYDFIKKTDGAGLNIWSYLWLFIIYPGGLGAVAVFAVEKLR